MFTGIVEGKHHVVRMEEGEQSWRLEVANPFGADEVALGDSVAVNGCCLTAVLVDSDRLTFDVLEETRRLTNLRDLTAGAFVNLERSMRFDGRVGGHFLTGHIDGLGRIEELRQVGKDVKLRIEAPKEGSRYLVYKGCLAIDGISLTVAEVDGPIVTIWLIPHTLEATTLAERTVGDSVNLEYDLLAKYAERILAKQDR